MWKQDIHAAITKDTTTYVHEGYVGVLKINNAHKVEIGHHYNGSGPGPSGFGADKWPVVSAKVTFAPGTEDLASEFAERLRIFISKELQLK